jgi:hypothetical protein
MSRFRVVLHHGPTKSSHLCGFSCPDAWQKMHPPIISLCSCYLPVAIRASKGSHTDISFHKEKMSTLFVPSGMHGNGSSGPSVHAVVTVLVCLDVGSKLKLAVFHEINFKPNNNGTGAECFR